MLQIRNLRKSFGDLQVLKSIDLDVNKGDVVAILGPSGSGKTTMLRCLNFLEKSDGGTMLFDDQRVDLARVTHAEANALRRRTVTRVATVLVLLVLSTAYVVGSTNSPFLYFNF